jgi:pimeloyl-ACP methyl ester carboxylesterase
MRISVGEGKLFFDIEGAKLLPDGPTMRERPTVVLLHGGPGMDHSIFKPNLSPLAEIAQLVFLDHRNAGRSDRTSTGRWTLENYADDLVALCEALEIRKPIVMGTSFGAWVAIAYASRHPDHPFKLILYSVSARVRRDRQLKAYERLGGAAARDAAQALWSNPGPQTQVEYFRLCIPLFSRRPLGTEFASRMILNPELDRGFRPDSVDLFAALACIQCPTLVMGGEDDPATTIEDAQDVAASIRQDLVRFERFTDASHALEHDQPERFLQVVREFISS